MASQNPQTLFLEIKSLENDNFACIDCQNNQTTHISLSHGTFICSSCASIHESLFPDLSKIKSDQEHFSDFDLKFLTSGGNKAFYEFLKYYNIQSSPIQQKYHTKAVYFYREMLKAIVFEQEIPNEMPNQIEGCNILTPKPVFYPELRPIDEPLLQTEESEDENSCFRKMFKCIFDTSHNIGKKVENKVRQISEKPSVKKAEEKTNEFFEKVGRTVDEISENAKVKKAKETVGYVFGVVKNEFNQVFKRESTLLNESDSTVSFDAAGAQELDN